MNTDVTTIRETNERMKTKESERVRRDLAATGRLALWWSVGGGLLLGGFAVAAMTLAGRLSGSGLFLTSGSLFLVGALLGYVHGAVLGYFGRPEGESPRGAARSLMKAGLYAIPALAVAWVVAGWIAMTVVGLYVDELPVYAIVGLAWVAGAATVGFAGWRGIEALRRAYARWPGRRAGTLLVGATYAALLVTFLADRPELWGLDLRVTGLGAVLLATGLTLWVAGPLITGALRLLRDLPSPRPSLGFAGDWKVNLLLGAFVGGALALLALPFHQPPLAVPAMGAGVGAVGGVLQAVGQALVDEVLLRLVLMTGVVGVLLRWHSLHREEAALIGVIGVVILQVILYLPGLAGMGFPSTIAGLGYAAVNVAVPAAAFGALYWLRGFGTALVADATALGALALLL